jgi:hypothetical protein
MEPSRWLLAKVPNFNALSPAERKAIRDFSVLWSLFEGTGLATNASAASLEAFATSHQAAGTLDLGPFQRAISYFRQRYYNGHSFTPAFAHLHLRQNDKRALVERFLRAQTVNDAETFTGLLIIVYRLRNNLFHGTKWAYGAQGQLNNLRHANNVLMAAMDLP